MFEPRASGPELTAEQRRVLDEEFFASDPTAHLRAKIDMLLRYTPATPMGAVVSDRLASLGIRDEALAWMTPDAHTFEAMRAVEAYALRHQCAETLIRLVGSALQVLTVAPARTLWEELEDGPYKIADGVGQIEQSVGEGVPLNLFATPEQEQLAVSSDAWPVHTGRAWAWTLHAMELLQHQPIDLTAANNKLKHGFVVRARTDVLASFIQADGIDDPTRFPLSRLRAAAPIIDGVQLQFIRREKLAPKDRSTDWMSLTTLNLDAEALLTEALMLTVVHGIVFGAAQARHIVARREKPPDSLTVRGLPDPAGYARRIRGIRQPLTLPRTGPHPAIVLEAGGEVCTIEVGQMIQGRVIDDAAASTGDTAPPGDPAEPSRSV